MEMRETSRSQMEFLQFIGYNWVLIRDGRLLDCLEFMWRCRRADFSLVRTLIGPRERGAERPDAAHVFFDNLLEVTGPESGQESLGE